MEVRDDINMNFNKLTNLKDPEYLFDAVNKKYVDFKINEITPSKDNHSKIDEILKEMKINYCLLKGTIAINTKNVGVEEVDELMRKHINSSLREVLENMDKNYNMLKNI